MTTETSENVPPACVDSGGLDQTAHMYGQIITKTCLYNFDLLKPHFYIGKLGYSLFFLFMLKDID